MEVTLISSEDLKKIQTNIEELMKNSQEWVSDKGASEMLGVHTKTLYRYRKLGLLPYSKTGRKVYYKKSDIAKYLSTYYNELIGETEMTEKSTIKK